MLLKTVLMMNIKIRQRVTFIYICAQLVERLLISKDKHAQINLYAMFFCMDGLEESKQVYMN